MKPSEQLKALAEKIAEEIDNLRYFELLIKVHDNGLVHYELVKKGRVNVVQEELLLESYGGTD
jgi:hypothetical protein